MNIKLTQSMAGERFSFVPRQIIRCSDETGARLVAADVGIEASPDAETDGELFDATAEQRLAAEQKQATRRGQPDKAVKPAPETPESPATAGTCAGRTTLGNPCKKAAVPGSKFCEKHQE